MDGIILYDIKDIKYEIVNYESEYIIYAKILNKLPKILGFINFKIVNEECFIKELIVYPNFKNKIDIEDFNIFDISKVLIKKSEKIAHESGVKYLINNSEYINIRKPLSYIYFYIFLCIILGLKLLGFLF